MHPVPSVQDLLWLTDDRLGSVVTADFSIHFRFKSGGIVQSEVAVSLIHPNCAIQTYDPQTKSGDLSFHALVGRTVERLRRPNDFSIEIDFRGAPTMRLISERGRYECGSFINPNGGEINF